MMNIYFVASRTYTPPPVLSDSMQLWQAYLKLHHYGPPVLRLRSRKLVPGVMQWTQRAVQSIDRARDIGGRVTADSMAVISVRFRLPWTLQSTSGLVRMNRTATSVRHATQKSIGGLRLINGAIALRTRPCSALYQRNAAASEIDERARSNATKGC
jgi:hypothetical protein